MNILFGEVTGDYLSDCLDNNSRLFEHEGSYYDFILEMSEDSFCIKDALGRYIPIGINEFEEFYQAVKLARNYAKPLSKYQHVSGLVESDETLVVCD